jgi:hypothetical protein
MTRSKRIIAGLAALCLAGAIWIPCLHLFFKRPASNFYRSEGLSPMAKKLAARHLQLWTDSNLRAQELEKMRASNAEWDFMGRTFLVWSLANMSLREPGERASYLATIDTIIEETLRIEKEKGMYFFLMDYARGAPWKIQPERSLFLDGEIAMMIACRRLVSEKAEYKTLLKERVDAIASRFEQSPNLILESYPDECWTFDHVLALDAIRIGDVLDQTDHSGLIREWVAMAKKRLVHPETGLLISNFTTAFTPLNGPEGSSLWMIAHGLQLLDAEFAREQYTRARKELSRITVGFGYAREWPSSWETAPDIDSGPIIPFFKISAGSSGMAFIGATAFKDEEFISSLAATLNFAGFPASKRGRLKYCASNQVGDAALLYAATLGPIWERVSKAQKL